MGKWTNYRNKLPKLQPEKEYQEKVNDEKNKVLGLATGQKANRRDAEHANVAFLGKKLAAARRKKDALEDKMYDINLTIEAIGQLLVDRLDGEEQESVDLRGGLTVGLKDDIYPMVKDRQKVFQYIKKTRQLELLSVHFKTLQSLTKADIEAGRPTMPGVEVFIKTTATIRGLRGAKENGDE